MTLLVVINIVILMAGCSERINKAKDLIVFGFIAHDDDRRVRHATALAFDVHRSLLTNVMKTFGGVERRMAAIDERTTKITRIHDAWRQKTATIPRLWEANEDLLTFLVVPSSVHLVYALLPRCDSMAYSPFYHQPVDEIDEPGPTKAKAKNEAPTYDSLEQVLVHLTRDWSDRGEETRRRLYFEGAIPALQLVLPVSAESTTAAAPSVLVPGAGLGRLAIELAARGYVVEVNECSGAMVCALKTIVTKVLPNTRFDNISSSSRSNDDSDNIDSSANTAFGTVFEFFPHINTKLIDSWDLAGRLSAARFPSPDSDFVARWIQSAASSSSPSQRPSLSTLHVQTGDFAQAYSAASQHRRFDSVVTCFFLDTATVLHQYLAVIAHVLKVGGVWVNVGPLHYHDPRAIPYSYVEVVQIILEGGFEQASHEVVNASYVGEEALSMKPEYYRVPLDVFRLVKPDEAWPMDGTLSTHSARDTDWQSPTNITPDAEDQGGIWKRTGKEFELI